MKLTRAAILVSRGVKVLHAAPAAYPYRYVAKLPWLHRMSDPFDPRPLLERPEHWRYGVCGWQHRYEWDERVAMSELGIGPDEAPLNDSGHVKAVFLRHRTLSDDKLAHLAAFTELKMVYLVGSAFTDECIPHLFAHPTLIWVWVGETMTERALRGLESQRPDMFVMRHGEAAIPDGRGGWRKL